MQVAKSARSAELINDSRTINEKKARKRETQNLDLTWLGRQSAPELRPERARAAPENTSNPDREST